MRHPFLVAAVAVLAVSNGFVLLHAAMNRRGTPNAELVLTARELRYNYLSDSMTALTLVWQTPGEPYQGSSPGWYDETKLKETGFDVSVPPDSKDAARHYVNARSREVFIALEFDGVAWQKCLAQNLDRRRAEAQGNARMEAELSQAEAQVERTASRLVAVDAGLDPEALRRKYPDRTRVMILRGVAQVFWQNGPQRPYVEGRIGQVLPQTIRVPSEFRGALPGGAYEVALRVGRQHEPWIADVHVAH